MPISKTAIAGIILFVLLQGCGRKGPLFMLPEPVKAVPVASDPVAQSQPVASQPVQNQPEIKK